MSVVSAPTKMRTPKEINGVILRRVMPLLIGAYIMAFLDRTNIGMAKDRLEIDLGISATAYGIGAGLFFLTYALSEIPSNLIMHKVGARFWIMRIMITWGIISACMASCRANGPSTSCGCCSASPRRGSSPASCTS